VNPLERIHTDIGLFHDAVECLTGEQYEALVARYACRCDEEDKRAHATAEFLTGLAEQMWGDTPRVTPEEKREAHRIAVALEPGEYDSDDLDRIQAAYEQRMREFEKTWESYP
jgi:hypothetical protein